MTQASPPSSLDLLVTSVATQLMAANAGNAGKVCQGVLADLVEAFQMDHSFLRHNDHAVRASRLVAEWPPRPDVPDPDPLAIVYFADADPVFADLRDRQEAHGDPARTRDRRLPAPDRGLGRRAR